ncbi:ABC transporter ATP-binding protein OS=Streptomyces microflavus OX=1919 GN=Smic_46840 PE=4 SV=1 [Streptomyces microflavus]
MPDRADARDVTDAVAAHDTHTETDATAGGARTAPPAVRVQGLWKRFGEQVAVSGIDLELPAGKFIGLVGPNGAGKTTTLSMVTGLCPTWGRSRSRGTTCGRTRSR